MITRLGVARSPALAVPLPPTLELEACYRYCEALVHARHHNYPVGSMFARSALRKHIFALFAFCLLYTSPSPRDGLLSRMPSSA